MSVDSATAAFRRLLADGAQGGQAKVDALVALSQRTVFVATWTADQEDIRTLINSNGQNALPIFTSEDQLTQAGEKLGWLGPDGKVPSKEIGARAAFRHLVAQDLGFIIVDIAAPHTFEAERSEVEPLLAGSRADSAGPFAAVGRISETMLQAVKKTPRPMQSVPPPTDLPTGALPQSSPGTQSSPGAESSPGTESSPGAESSPAAETGTIEGDLPPARPRPPSIPPPAPPIAPPAGMTASARSGAAPDMTFGSGAGSVTVQPLGSPPDDELLDALSDVLRSFPEVEWASFFLASRGPTDARPTVGLRVDTSYRARVQEIIQKVRAAADAKGATIDTLLLDDPTLVREARAQAIVFFPWRRRPS